MQLVGYVPRCSISVHHHVPSAALGAAGVAAVVTVVVGVAGAAVARRGLAPASAVLAVPERRLLGVKGFFSDKLISHAVWQLVLHQAHLKFQIKPCNWPPQPNKLKNLSKLI